MGFEDVEFLSDSIANNSVKNQRAQLLSLIESGVFKNEDGSTDEALKNKILTLFGVSINDKK